MSHLADVIVYLWLLPVALQIVLPLGMFMLWMINKAVKIVPTTSKSTEEYQHAMG